MLHVSSVNFSLVISHIICHQNNRPHIFTEQNNHIHVNIIVFNIDALTLLGSVRVAVKSPSICGI